VPKRHFANVIKCRTVKVGIRHGHHSAVWTNLISSSFFLQGSWHKHWSFLNLSD
jgi:hypothetical protein